ncbi:helix-turn-helix domain-containing protein [Mucilaginibacter antarcticus]|uniref:Helix-turn-helix domain-containing protein n=1 Tax=Mucilaginibacter antarcticus TaxID=1855725 RepID=A0ABW5XPT3_9SPHI
MKILKSITDYYKEISVAPPVYPFFDVRRHEENINTIKMKQKPVRHELYSVSVFTEMEADLQLDNTMVNGKAFIISPLKTISWNIKSKTARGWYLIFDQEFIESNPFWKNFTVDFNFFKPETNLSFDIPGPVLEEVLYHFRKIHAELYAPSPEQFRFIHSHTNLVLLLIKRHLENKAGQPVDFKHITDRMLLASKFQELVESTVSGSKNNPELRKPSYYAEKLNIHPNYLNAVVRDTHGKTASQLIQLYLIGQAKIAIRHERLSVKETAWRLHFPDIGNFIVFFKKHTGITPGQYASGVNI